MAGSKEIRSSSSPACRGVKEVVVAAQEIQLINKLVAAGKPVREKLR